MKKLLQIVCITVVAVLFSACGTTVPKPYGYFRIALPEKVYQEFDEPGFPYRFEYSESAQVQARTADGEEYWIDIVYPSIKAQVNCTYKPIKGNLRELGADAEEFVYKHAGVATSIPEQGYENTDARVYGVYYELRGNTATPCQFYLTDSTHHFFRGALYYGCVPNQDSLAPITDFMCGEIRHLMETMEWK